MNGSHWHKFESVYRVFTKGELMNDAIFDIQNMRKSILNCTQNMRVEDDTDRLFVKSLCGVMGVLADFEMLYLGRKFKLLDEDTLALNLEMVKARIASMFADPCPADDTPVLVEGPADDGDMDISAVEDDGLVTLTVKFPVGLRSDLVVEHFKKALREGGC